MTSLACLLISIVQPGFSNRLAAESMSNQKVPLVGLLLSGALASVVGGLDPLIPCSMQSLQFLAEASTEALRS